jgi:hypothetical protein
MRRLFAFFRALLASASDAILRLGRWLSPSLPPSPSPAPSPSSIDEVLAAGVDVRPADRLRLQVAVALRAGGTA